MKTKKDTRYIYKLDDLYSGLDIEACWWDFDDYVTMYLNKKGCEESKIGINIDEEDIAQLKNLLDILEMHLKEKDNSK